MHVSAPLVQSQRYSSGSYSPDSSYQQSKCQPQQQFQALSSSSSSPAPKKKHICPTCDRAFTTSGHLARHSRIHTVEQKPICPFPGCKKRFFHQNNLELHYRTHIKSGSTQSDTRSAIAHAANTSPSKCDLAPVSHNNSKKHSYANPTISSKRKRISASTGSASDPPSSPASYNSFDKFATTSSVTPNTSQSPVDPPFSSCSRSNPFNYGSNSNGFSDWSYFNATNKTHSRPGSAQSGSSGGRSDSP